MNLERSWLLVLVGVALLGAIVTIAFSSGGVGALTGFVRNLVYASAIMGILLLLSFVVKGVLPTVKSRGIQVLILGAGILMFLVGDRFAGIPGFQVYALTITGTSVAGSVDWLLGLLLLLGAVYYYYTQSK